MKQKLLLLWDTGDEAREMGKEWASLSCGSTTHDTGDVCLPSERLEMRGCVDCLPNKVQGTGQGDSCDQVGV